jgi:hypothetical protein
MDWIHLAQDRDQWKTLVNTIMNLGAPWNVGKLLASTQLAAFQKGSAPCNHLWDIRYKLP